MSTLSVIPNQERKFTITVLGRTLEHLGVQMYKRRDIAIVELVANCWDAGAKTVYITIPEGDTYNQETDEVTITDDGTGMSPDDVQNDYLVIGRNRRKAGSPEIIVPAVYDEPEERRPVMGRKGIGKLAGFGIATEMTLITWQKGIATKIKLDVASLKKEDGMAEDVGIVGTLEMQPQDVKSATGTRLILRHLKHKTPIDLAALNQALARRFSRRARGRMKIYVNDVEVPEPALDISDRFPESGYKTETLSDGHEVSYYYAFSENTIKQPDLRGFTIYVRDKTAQAPPFFFKVEGTASGQHATRYVTGEIIADFLDAGTDDESDLISTDRQEIDWDAPEVKPLLEWGDKLARRALREWTERRGDTMENTILSDEKLRHRIDRLDKASQKQIKEFARIVGQADAAPEHAREIGDALIRAYEYRQFHDIISQIEAVGDDPERLQDLLVHLIDWRVLESRAILEIVKGRLDIIIRFQSMINNNAPETPSPKSSDNMHDLIAQYPWLLNPEWQVLSEEKTISKQLREWGEKDVPDPEINERYDFLALDDNSRLIIIEIKRSDHALELEELQRLEKYREWLSRSRDNIYMLMISSGKYNVSEAVLKSWREREDGDIDTWNNIFERTRKYYEHYRAVLEGDVEDSQFANKASEVARTRIVIDNGTNRGKEERKKGIGPQDVSYSSGDDSVS